MGMNVSKLICLHGLILRENWTGKQRIDPCPPTNPANETHPDRTLKLEKGYPQIAQIHADKTENHRRKSASSAEGMF